MDNGNQIIHFTDSLDKIISILKDEHLRLKYCKEEFCIDNRQIVSKNVHPMVCFSEQNVNSLKDQKITYGKYGIAFCNNWITRNQIQPVIYIEQDSEVARSLSKLLAYRRNLPKGHKLRLPIMTIKCFTKNAIGKNSKCNAPNFSFKQEKEWRYVPKKNQIGKGYISENRSTFLKNEELYNKKLQNYPLKFDRESDILCVYYENESDKTSLKDLIDESKLRASDWEYVKCNETN